MIKIDNCDYKNKLQQRRARSRTEEKIKQIIKTSQLHIEKIVKIKSKFNF